MTPAAATRASGLSSAGMTYHGRVEVLWQVHPTARLDAERVDEVRDAPGRDPGHGALSLVPGDGPATLPHPPPPSAGNVWRPAARLASRTVGGDHALRP